MPKQHTVASDVTATGVALHSGVRVQITLKSAPPDTGIIFRRTDLNPPEDIPARAELVKETRLATTLVHGQAKVATVEHLLAACVGCGIDNAIIELDNLEVPIMDGSSAPFVYLIEQAGVAEQAVARRYIEILEPVRVEMGDKFAELLPNPHFEVDFTIDFSHPAIPDDQCRVRMKLEDEDFLSHISRARTFGFAYEVETLRSMGLAQGGSMENAVVLDEYKVLNREGLRFADELARHKVLDAVGDLFLLGHRVRGKYHAFKSGHELNNKLCLALLAKPAAWRYAT
ncbi:MAG TPA: UDP-3-O-acyl-N-acetylglucosamine deacetylase [Casimicrobium huifangae]|jgi:UDP-3-O-[3-hydroxymyristoyl] N-acetylglucosamine deacetylase|uniref:UDP-3-O-acyl-N-acetylglucosamine deacetylase n=1 Tax=Casimicrobium huifangae TaxID=2591109 RepID=UPI002BC18E26|nr:UDP-3-O-acyl-N-acetylglucosamine deacetylase [Casimicrobium huifangae]HQA35643.1 UDP-3-O-acyl-N-acetylglucosamine deacetylase [Casimicrobium huifangae]HQD65810.1 UDP-3-O-acyl-N-acetylglucosamine deacetylase [Casimicrobium huifangae]